LIRLGNNEQLIGLARIAASDDDDVEIDLDGEDDEDA